MPIFRLFFEISFKLKDYFIERIRQIDVGIIKLWPIIGTDETALNRKMSTLKVLAEL